MSTSAATRAGAIRWLVPLVLLVVAAAVRLAGLDQPERIYFDETYYVSDAVALLERGVEQGFTVHPPTGKWLLAAGIALLGDRPVGWRAASAAAGTLTVLFVYLAGLRLFRHRGLAALAGLLVAFDGLLLALSRIAMLDAILVLFITAAFWLLLVDAGNLWRGVGGRPPHAQAGEDATSPPERPRWALWLAGFALGLAVATKWSGLLAVGAAGLFVLGSELAFRRRTTGRLSTGWPRLLATLGLPLLLLPAALYVLSYAGWFANYEHSRPGVERCPEPDEPCAVALPTRVADWAREQREIARFHVELDADHPYRASALTWPALYRPIAFHYESCGPEREAELAAEGEDCVVERGNVAHVLGMGNPALFWLALPAYALLFWAGFVRRDWRALAISTFLLGQYVPWLAAARPVFLFYAAPLVPFVALSLGHVAYRTLPIRGLRWVPAAIAALVVAGFVFWFPLFAGLEISTEAWDQRIWSDRWR